MRRFLFGVFLVMLFGIEHTVAQERRWVYNYDGVDLPLCSGAIVDLIAVDTSGDLCFCSSTGWVKVAGSGTCVTATPSYLLMETGSYVLLESGDKIVLEN